MTFDIRSALLFAGRCLYAPLFVLSGVRKLTFPDQIIGAISKTGLPLPLLGYWGSTALETVGLVLFVAGLRTRALATILFVYSLVTAFVFHTHLGQPDQMNNFLKNLSIAGGFLVIAAVGGGAWSLDNAIETFRSRRTSSPGVATASVAQP